MHVRALIRAGTLSAGTQLPPVRDIALALGVSPATVSAAWGDLRRRGILTGRGRTGMTVNGERILTQPERFAAAGRYDHGVLDLSLAVPDTALLPPLDRALAYGAAASGLNSYVRVQIQPDLEQELRLRWPYEPPMLQAVNGGYSGVHMVLNALSLADAVVAVEDPTPMRHLDILENLGAIILPVTSDADGPDPRALAEAMRQRPAAFLFQPRLHSVTGRCVTPRRLRELGDVLAQGDTTIIEDDGLSDLAPVAPQSLGSRFPDRTVHILSFAKTLGPDLRLAVMSGSPALLEQVRAFRSFNSGWTSRILQSAAAWLLRDPRTADIVHHARETYTRRCAALQDAALANGLRHDFGCGLSTWLPVTSETFAMITLAAHGIAALPGGRLSVLQGNHVRLATGIVDSNQEKIARALMLAQAAHD